MLTIADHDIRYALRREIAADAVATDANAVADNTQSGAGEQSVSAVG